MTRCRQSGIIGVLKSREEKNMYTKDKSQRITLRLSDAQFDFVKTVADALGVSPSEYLRMMVNLSMVGAQNAGKDGVRRENEQTSGNHIV